MQTLSEIAKLLGSQGGKKRAENLSPERRKEIATKAVRAREEKRRLNNLNTKETK